MSRISVGAAALEHGQTLQQAEHCRTIDSQKTPCVKADDAKLTWQRTTTYSGGQTRTDHSSARRPDVPP